MSRHLPQSAPPVTDATRPDSRKAGGPAAGLLIAALGIVFGDIATSPLYAFGEIFQGAHDIGVSDERVFGAASCVFWTLTLIVSVKYVLIVMRADNEGEGGIMSLATLTRSVPGVSSRAKVGLLTLGVFGAALFYGDGMITPAVSVLSAMEGLEVADPDLKSIVIPGALVILVGLFLVQKRGTGVVGKAFGPVMLLWCATIAVLGIGSLLKSPEIVSAVNPWHAVNFFVTDPGHAFLALGSVVLCVTGAEALYADMGHFGPSPIRISWFAIVVPALYINYFGQAALVLREPGAVSDPFFLLAPDALQLPLTILATAATVIASQAVISGAFSMTEQAVNLGYLPRMRVLHTSASSRGQIYVPAVNWFLMIAVIGLVLGFRSSSHLASAYGIAVTGTFVITTILITVVARHDWGLSWWVVGPVSALFLCIDGAFFAANLTKFSHGGWFPLLVAAVIFSALMIWQRGNGLLRRSLATEEVDMTQVLKRYRSKGEAPLLTSAVYVSGAERDQAQPISQLGALYGSIGEQVVLMTVTTAETPSVPDDQKVVVGNLHGKVVEVQARYGFMESPDVPHAIALAAGQGVPLDPDACVFVVNSARVEVKPTGPLRRLARALFAFMYRNATDPVRYFGLPTNRTVEVVSVVDI